MGVKSTTRLTRSAAEELYVELCFEKEAEKLKRSLRSAACLFNNEELEGALERANDARFSDGQGGFDNYLITE